MDPSAATAASSLTDRFKAALDACDASHAKADLTPVVSEMRHWANAPSFSPLRELGAALPQAPSVLAGPPPAAAPCVAPPAAPRLVGDGGGGFRAAPVGAVYPSPPLAASPATSCVSVLKITGMALAALALAAAVFFIRRRILAWYRGRTGGFARSPDDDPDADEAAPLLRSGSERPARRPPGAATLPSAPLLPQALRRRARLASDPELPPRSVLAQSPPRQETRARRSARPLHQPPATSRRVTIREPAEGTESTDEIEELEEVPAAQPRAEAAALEEEAAYEDPNFVPL